MQLRILMKLSYEYLEILIIFFENISQHLMEMLANILKYMLLENTFTSF